MLFILTQIINNKHIITFNSIIIILNYFEIRKQTHTHPLSLSLSLSTCMLSNYDFYFKYKKIKNVK